MRRCAKWSSRCWRSTIGSEPGEAAHRGGFVACGNTHPKARKIVNGLRERGVPADGTFNSRTGAGYVAKVDGDYKLAGERGIIAIPLLLETFGGFGPELMELLREAAEFRKNKLTAREYDETTWSARSWLSFVTQRISVALHRAAAREVGQALGLGLGPDPRPT